MEKIMKYAVIYLKTQNVNLIKDMGLIPYFLYKKYNYESEIITYKNGEYPYLENEVKGLKLSFVDKIFKNYSLDGAFYLTKKSKEIDMLQVFHMTLSSVVYTIIYKLCNKSGKIYLKLDCYPKLIAKIKTMNIFQRICFNYFLKKVDLISVEQEYLYKELKVLLKNHESKLINLTNGIDLDYINKLNFQREFKEKENIILNVSRIGAEEKNTTMLLNAFSKIPNINNLNWKLFLVGPIEEEYKEYLNKFFEENPNLKDKIQIFGNIVNRKELYNLYNKSKIFSLTSNFESFAFAFVEAAIFGCVIVSTNVGIASEIVSDNGALVEPKDEDKLSLKLLEYMNSKDLEKLSHKTMQIAEKKFNMENTSKKLNFYLQNLIK